MNSLRQTEEAARQMLDALEKGFRDMKTVKRALQLIAKGIPPDSANCSIPRLKKRLGL